MIGINYSRADFRFCGKCKIFEIATVLSITHVSMCHTNLWSFPVLYSMPISEFPIPSSKNRFTLYLFSPFLSRLLQTTMCNHGMVWRETSESNWTCYQRFYWLIVWNLEHQELKKNHITQKILVKFTFTSKKAYLRNTLCSRLDLKFHLKVMSDICNGFWMIFFYSGDFGILLKKKTLQIAFLTAHHLFCTRFSLQPTYNIIWWVFHEIFTFIYITLHSNNT